MTHSYFSFIFFRLSLLVIIRIISLRLPLPKIQLLICFVIFVVCLCLWHWFFVVWCVSLSYSYLSNTFLFCSSYLSSFVSIFCFFLFLCFVSSLCFLFIIFVFLLSSRIILKYLLARLVSTVDIFYAQTSKIAEKVLRLSDNFSPNKFVLRAIFLTKPQFFVISLLPKGQGTELSQLTPKFEAVCVAETCSARGPKMTS